MAQDNMKAAEQTYSGFITMTKVGSVIVALVACLVIILIS